MNYNEILQFAKEYIEGLLCVPVSVIGKDKQSMSDFFKHYIPTFYSDDQSESFMNALFLTYPDTVISHITDWLHIHYLLLPYNDTSYIIIGPYITQTATPQFCKQLIQLNHVPKNCAIAFQIYYNALTVCLQSKIELAATILMRSLNNQTEPPDIVKFEFSELKIPKIHEIVLDQQDEIAKQLIVERYEAERRFLMEVYYGNTEKAVEYYAEFQEITKSIKRADNPLRSQKNLGFTLNTDLRIAAQKAGVHPIYLDNISSNFSRLIEHCNNLDEINELKSYMIPAYTRLVRQQTLKDYSPSVRSVILYIKHHLNETITLSTLAKEIGLSSSYLSKLFNSEVGESIPNYINRLRSDLAAQLLKSTTLPIKDICSQIGYYDTNYFTKIFKRYYSMSPSEYRIKNPYS